MKEPILIIGAGPTGLTLALTLKRHGVPFRIIDQEATPHKESRALGIHARTMEVFDDLGVSKEILRKALKVNFLDIYLSKKLRAELDISVLKAPHPYITILPQSETEHILAHALHLNDVRVERAKKLLKAEEKEDCIEVVLENEDKEKEIVNALWVIGCDGAHSVIRKNMGAIFEGKEYPLQFALADVQMKSSLGIDKLYAFGGESGSIFIFPMQEDFYRIVFQKIEGKDKEHTNLLALEHALKERALGSNKILDVEWISDFKISCRQANIYRKNRFFIAGDAAHIHSPAGGQGLNTGVQDAYNLGWKLAYVCKYNAKTKLLSSYSRERILIGKEVLHSSDRLTKIMSNHNPKKVQSYSRIIQTVNRMPLLKKMIAYQLSGISLRYKKSPIIQSQKRLFFFIPAIKAGCRHFDGELMESKSKLSKRVFELTRGSEHVLFLFFKEKKFLKAKTLKENLEKKYPKILKVFLVTSSFSIQEGECWIDREKLNASPYRLKYPFMVMVRPDKYIGLTKRGLKEKSVVRYFEKLLGLYL